MSFRGAAIAQRRPAAAVLSSEAATPLRAAHAPTADLSQPAQPDAGWAVANVVQRAQRGDPSAVAELYERHAGQIFRYCLFRVDDQAAAEDVTGEVFLKMLEGLPNYRYYGVPFVAWLYRIARDRVTDYRRRQVRRPAEALSDALPEGGPALDEQVTRRLHMASIATAMNELSDEQQVVVQLRFVDGHSLEETAHRMGKTTGAIKAMQLRALRRLARIVGRSPGEAALAGSSHGGLP